MALHGTETKWLSVEEAAELLADSDMEEINQDFDEPTHTYIHTTSGLDNSLMLIASNQKLISRLQTVNFEIN